MTLIRAFIAISLSNEVTNKLGVVSDRLQHQLGETPIRWVPPNKIHLTLLFLGEISSANVEIIKEMLISQAINVQKFAISIGGIGAFPNRNHPKVIWVGVESPQELCSFQSILVSETSRFGYQPENRPFSPHLTLGRVSRNTTPEHIRQISQVLSCTKVGFIGAVNVGFVHLYQSDLHPDGAQYTRLASAEFGG